MNILIQLIALSFIALSSAAQSSSLDLPDASPSRMEQRIIELSAFGKNAGGGVSRLAFGQHDIDARHYIRALMTQAGLVVRIDAAGNLIGRKEDSEPLPPKGR
jgi:hypothetical protein